MPIDSDSGLNITGYVDVTKINGKYYYMHDKELRDRINADVLDENYITIPTSAIVYLALRDKWGRAEQENFVNSLPKVVSTGDFNDLSNIPSGFGVYVDNTDLVFTGLSDGGMSGTDDQNLSHLVGNGII